jgi:hypothetical protein
MSEVQALFARQRDAAPEAVRGKPGGFPVADDYEVRVRDPDSGRLLPAGESGELEFRGPSRVPSWLSARHRDEDSGTHLAWLPAAQRDECRCLHSVDPHRVGSRRRVLVKNLSF